MLQQGAVGRLVLKHAEASISLDNGASYVFLWDLSTEQPIKCFEMQDNVRAVIHVQFLAATEASAGKMHSQHVGVLPIADGRALGGEQPDLLAVLGQDGVVWFLNILDGSVQATLGPPEHDFIDQFQIADNGRSVPT